MLADWNGVELTVVHQFQAAFNLTKDTHMKKTSTTSIDIGVLWHSCRNHST